MASQSMISNSLRDKFYQEAACKDINPGFFDGTNPNDIYTKAGLNVCESCTVQLECVVIVKPRESYFDGVCGGKVWANGNIVGDRAGLIQDIWDGVDRVAVERLIKGEIIWTKVPMKERKFAAVEMRKNGFGVSVIMNTVHMSGAQLKKLFEKEGIV
jgi:hypothetical protein